MPFQLLPLPLPPLQGTSPWNSGIQRMQHGDICLMKSKEQFAHNPGGLWSPSQERKPPYAIAPHSFPPAAPLVHPSGCWAWISHLSLVSLCYMSSRSAQPWGTVPSSWPWSPLYLSDTLPQAGNNRPWGALRTEEPRRSYFQLRMFWPAAQALFRFLIFFRIFSLHHWEKHN